MFKKYFSNSNLKKINSIILCTAVFHFNEDKKKEEKELPVTVYIQLQKRLTWLEQVSLPCFSFNYTIIISEGKKKTTMSHLWSDPRKDQLALFGVLCLFIRHRIYLTHCRYSTVSHNACITFCEEFNELTIYLATTQRRKLKRTVTV